MISISDVIQQVQFIDKEHHRSILETINEHQKNPAVLIEAFLLLALLARSGM